MKRFFSLLAFICLGTGLAFGQVKIGENPQALNSSSLLELESNSRVFVVTRLSQAQMTAITPLQGALAYNTDENCIFQYDGTQWVNLCQAFNVTFADNGDGTYTFSNGTGPITFDGTGVDNFELNTDGELVFTKSDGTSFTVPLQTQINDSFTADAIVNDSPSIVITDTGTALNFEVSEISGANIADGTVNGFLDIQFKSITDNQMAAESIGTPELKPTSVTKDKIDFSSVTLGDFLNDPGFITDTEIVSTDPGNSITNSGGAFYDDSSLLTDIQLNQIGIADNFTLIDNHLTGDMDLSATNEVNTAFQVNGSNLELTDSNSTFLVPLANLGSDDQNLVSATLDGSSQLQIDIENGTGVAANLSALEESADIAQNASDIADNATDIATNTANITSNANDVSTLQSNVATINASITANAGNITTLQGDVATNAGNITSNTTNIANTTTAITTNTTAIGTNAASIATNTAAIAANTTAIAADTDGSATNEVNTAFQVNAGNLEITDSAGTLAVALNSLGTDDQNLGTATLDGSAQLAINIEGGTGTSADLSALEESADIAQNASDIADNTTEIATNTADITTNANDISTLQGTVATNTGSINTNITAIGTNTTNIAANTTAIGNNTTNIGNNTTNIGTNTTNIMTNATAIAAHNTADADLSISNELQTISLTGRTLDISNIASSVTLNSFNSIRADNTTTTVVTNADYTLILNVGVTNLTLPGQEAGRILILKNLSGGAITTSDPFLDESGTSTTVLGTGITWLQSDGTNWHRIN